MSTRATLITTLLAAIALAFSSLALAQDDAPKQTLFTNVNVFDGHAEELAMGMNVLVEGNLIRQVSEEAINAPGATVIDGGGRTLLPGFIETHAHLMLMGPSLPAMEGMTTWEDFAIHGTKMAEMYLMQGFTTVRDAGGSNAGLRRAIDSGMIVGPRFYPSAAFIGTRGGHADFANYTAPVGESTNFGRLNMAQEADSVADVQKFGRNNFRMGATQLKYMQSGGVVSAFDPWQLLAGSLEEIEAAVQVANEYGSYVMAHSYRKEAIMTALNAGVKSIEHGFSFDCEISRLMKKKGAYITTNLTAFDPGLLDIPAVANVPASLAKAKSASATFAGYIDNMKQCPAKRGFQTDCVGSVTACNIQIAYEKHLNNEFFGPHTSLVTMTSVGRGLLGRRHGRQVVWCRAAPGKPRDHSCDHEGRRVLQEHAITLRLQREYRPQANDPNRTLARVVGWVEHDLQVRRYREILR
jgi:imidazolonepropionase-like amidohydrolase